MSDVKRYLVTRGSEVSEMVYASDYDRDTQALKDELDNIKRSWGLLHSERDELRAQAVPDGYVLVPVDPTPEMLDRYPFNVSAVTSEPMDKEDLRVVYQAMLAAAPSAQQKESGDE